MQPVLVCWLDSVRYREGWQTEEWWLDVLGSRHLGHRTCGFLLHQTEEYVALALNEATGRDDASQVIQIPRAAIVSIQNLSLEATASAVASEEPRANV